MGKLEQVPSPEKPRFNSKIDKEVLNFKTGETYHLLGGSEMKLSEGDISRIVEICSQEEIYDFLFRRPLQGKPYTEENAKWFASWLQKGWEDNTHFVFIIRNTLDQIVGAIDIKSPDLERAEVGYWADRNSGGFVTNALHEMVSVAKDAGYKKLYAQVLPNNAKSSGVLERAGFDRQEDMQVEDRTYNFFEKII